jgi:hypothetical protein
MRKLLNIVHQAVKIPLRVDLALTSQSKPVQAFVVAQVAKHGFDCRHAAAIQLSPLRTVYGLLHALREPEWRCLVLFEEGDLAYRRTVWIAQALGPEMTRTTVALGAGEFLICAPIGHTVITVAIELFSGWTDAGIGRHIMHEIPRSKALG